MRNALFVLALMLAFTAPGSAQTLPNPSFENAAAGRPAGWNTQTWAGQANFRLSESARAGGRSVEIASAEGADAAWFALVPVKPFSVYRLSAWIKTEGVTPTQGGQGALLNLHARPERTQAVTGTKDWTKADDALQVNCLFGGFGRAKGRAWFDDVRLELVSSQELRPAVTIGAAQGEPISPYIYSQFIGHLGRCIYGGIWAEILEDRKFYDPVGQGASPWRAMGGATVRMDTREPFVGDHTPVVAAPGGITQGGLNVEAGKTYVGRMWLAGDATAASVRVSLVWGDGATVTVRNLGAKWAKTALRFAAPAASDKARLEIVSVGGGAFRVAPSRVGRGLGVGVSRRVTGPKVPLARDFSPSLLLPALLLCAVTAFAQPADAPAPLPAPPPELVKEFGLKPFYKKHLDVGGLPVLSSGKVSDFALREAAYLISEMLRGREDVLRAMAKNRVRFVVMAPDEMTTAVPEHSDLTPPKYWDRRARGLGATPHRPAVSCGEENLLGYPGDPYSTENILIHEFAHAVHDMGLNTLDSTFDTRLKHAYDAAMAKGLWKGKYAAVNHHEYWAEGVQSWFDTNRPPDHDHNEVNTREELRAYDPALAALIAATFPNKGWRYTPAAKRPDAPHLRGYDPAKAPRFGWDPALVEWYRSYEAEKKNDEKRRKDGTKPDGD